MDSNSPVVLNLMLGRHRGGLEQAAIDYAQALSVAAIPSVSVISPQAWAEASLVANRLPYRSLANPGLFSLAAVWQLRKLARDTGASVVICHGNRALSLALRAFKGRIPVIAVAHNASTRRFIRAEHSFSITRHLALHLQQHGITRISHMPNAVRIPASALRGPYRVPPVIGAMGRYVSKKGFETYIDALALLKARGIVFEAILGGEGPLAEALQARINSHGLQREVTMAGWVEDKSAFFSRVDVFVLPSLDEPFGIVLIEAMAHGVPVITSDASGPQEIVHHGVDALVTPRGNAVLLADALAHVLQQPETAERLGMAGRALVMQEYSIPAMATRLKSALAPYIGGV